MLPSAKQSPNGAGKVGLALVIALGLLFLLRRRYITKQGNSRTTQKIQNSSLPPESNEPLDLTKATPFLGISLADNIKDDALVVDGLFLKGPAHRAGIHLDDELEEINGATVRDMETMLRVVNKHCIPGNFTTLAFRREEGELHTVRACVMTAEKRFAGSPYYFDPTVQGIEESTREKEEKRSWREMR